jgi:hypothetical protein
MKLSRKLMMLLAVLLSFSLVAAACGDDDDDTADAGSDDAADTGSDDAADTGSDDYLGDGSLGTVVVEPGAQVQIRSLNAISGDVAFLGVPNQRGVEAAVADFGDIKGFEVTSGEGLDDLCSAEGGQAAAQQIVADEQVVGVIGTSCSGAAASAAPLISDAGLVMISGSNTSPCVDLGPRRYRWRDLPPGLLPHGAQRPVPGRRHGRLRVQRPWPHHGCGRSTTATPTPRVSLRRSPMPSRRSVAPSPASPA